MEYLSTGQELSIMKKLEILTDAAKYDVACTSSGVERKGNGTGIGNCAKSGIIETEEPPELLSHIATDLIIHELYVWCSQNGNFSLRERARQYAEVAYHVKPQYRMTPAQRAEL